MKKRLFFLTFAVLFIFTLLNVNAEVCGDTICDGNETKATCSSDCNMFRLGIGEPIALNNLTSTYNWSIHDQVSNLTSFHPKIFRMWFRMDNQSETNIGGCLINSTLFNSTGCARFNLTVYLVQKQNITVIGMDHSFPRWMTGSLKQEGRIPYPRDLTPGSTYMKFLENYSDAWYTLALNFTNIKYWETGNEFNSNSFLKGYNVNNGDDVTFTFAEKVSITIDLMNASRYGIKKAIPDAFIFMPGLAPLNKSSEQERDSNYNINLTGIRDFINETYNSIESGQWPSTNPRDYFDGIAWHPYSNYIGPSMIWDDNTNWTYANQKIYSVIKQHEGKDIPVLFSEYGYYDYSTSSNWNTEANWTYESLNISLEYFPWLWGITWFRLNNIPRAYYLQPPDDYDPAEISYGLLYNNSGANNGLPIVWKPIAYTIESFINNYPIPDYTIYSYEFNNLGSFDGFSILNLTDNRSVGGLIYGRPTTNNPVIYPSAVSIDADSVSQLQIHSSDDCGGNGKFYFFKDNNWYFGGKYNLTNDNIPNTYNISLFENSDWTGTITNFSIYPTNYTNCNFTIDSIRFNSLSIFTLKNPAGNDVAWFGRNGDLVLKGECFVRPCESISLIDNSFVIMDSTNDVVAYINKTGDLCIETGDCSDQSALCNPTLRDAFLVQNKTGNNVSYIDFDGDLCLTGRLYKNSNP